MHINLTPDQRALVQKAIESGRFEREEQAVQEALALWETDAALLLQGFEIAKRAARLATAIRLRTLCTPSPWGLSQGALEAPH